MNRTLLAGAAALASAPLAFADENHPHGARADSHAPIGVMGDHAHNQGEWMFSYRFMRMDMEGSRIGTDSVTPEEIVTTVPNIAGMPPTLRVVPTEMTMDMHMFGAMYGLTDEVTLMVMANYLVNEMDHVTFAGPAGADRLGTFTTKSDGFGDTTVSALWKARETATDRLVVQGGFSVPTGSIEESDDVLTPMNTNPTLRLPYPMQLGSGTVDPLAAVTYARNAGVFGWGAQGSALLRLYENENDWNRGDEYRATAWASFAPAPAFSVSARAAAQSIGEIEGRDVLIAAPVQTANPEFQGGERIDLGVGANWAGQGALRGHRLAAEVMIPTYQDLNGPQLETDWTLTVGYQFTLYGR